MQLNLANLCNSVRAPLNSVQHAIDSMGPNPQLAHVPQLATICKLLMGASDWITNGIVQCSLTQRLPDHHPGALDRQKHCFSAAEFRDAVQQMASAMASAISASKTVHISVTRDPNLPARVCASQVYLVFACA